MRNFIFSLFGYSPSRCAHCCAEHEGGWLWYCRSCGQSFDGKKYGPPLQWGVRWPEPTGSSALPQEDNIPAAIPQLLHVFERPLGGQPLVYVLPKESSDG